MFKGTYNQALDNAINEEENGIADELRNFNKEARGVSKTTISKALRYIRTIENGRPATKNFYANRDAFVSIFGKALDLDVADEGNTEHTGKNKVSAVKNTESKGATLFDIEEAMEERVDLLEEEVENVETKIVVADKAISMLDKIKASMVNVVKATKRIISEHKEAVNAANEMAEEVNTAIDEDRKEYNAAMDVLDEELQNSKVELDELYAELKNIKGEKKYLSKGIDNLSSTIKNITSTLSTNDDLVIENGAVLLESITNDIKGATDARTFLAAVKKRLIAEKDSAIADMKNIKSKLEAVSKRIAEVEAARKATMEEKDKVDAKFRDKYKKVTGVVAENDNELKKLKNRADTAKNIRRNLIENIKVRYAKEYNRIKMASMLIERKLAGFVKPNKKPEQSTAIMMAEFIGSGMDNEAVYESIKDMMPAVYRLESNKHVVMNAIQGLRDITNDRSELTRFGVNQTALEAEQTVDSYKNPLLIEIDGKSIESLLTSKLEASTVRSAANMATVIIAKAMTDVATYNDNQLEEFVEASFDAILPSKGDAKRGGVVTTIKNAIKKGNFVPISTFRVSAGREFINQLGIKLDRKNLTSQVISDIEAALGTFVIDNMLGYSGKSVGVTKAEVVTIDGILTVSETGAGKADKVNGKENFINIVKFIKHANDAFGLKDEARAKENKNVDINPGKVSIRKMSAIGAVFEYASVKGVTTIDTEPILHKEGKLTRNANTKLSKSEIKALNDNGSKKWKFNKNFTDAFKKSLEVNNNNIELVKRDFVIGVLGRKDDILADTHPIDFESVSTNYDADVLAIERMIDAYVLVGENPFYLGWDYTVSNRLMLDNTWLNPQNSKISRFVVGMSDMFVEVDPKNFKDGDKLHTQLAIAQALEIGPDKKVDENTIAALEKFVKFTEDDKIEVVHEGLKPLFENDGAKLTMTAVRKALNENDHIATSKNFMHIMQAMYFIRDFNRGEKFETNLALEADGITNGMAITLMQMGLSKATIELLRKAGVYVNTADIISEMTHGMLKTMKSFVDIYETPVEAFKSNLDEGKAAIISDIIENGNWRTFLKYRVMTFIYGVGMSNNSAAAARQLVMDAIRGDSKRSGKEKLVLLSKLLGKDDAEVNTIMSQIMTGEMDKIYDPEKGMLVQMKHTTDDTKGNYVVLNNAQLDVLVKAVLPIVDIPLDKAFKKVFGEISEFRKTLKNIEELAFVIFNQMLKKELTDIGVKDGAMHNATGEQLEATYAKMINDGTYYAARNSSGGIQDYMKTDISENGEIMTIQVNPSQFQSNKPEVKSANISKQVRKAISNVGAVGVTTVHSIDGSIMITGNVSDVLNIFDALVLGINSELNEQELNRMNKAFYEQSIKHSILGEAVDRLVSLLNKEGVMDMLDADNVSDDFAVSVLADYTRIHTEVASVASTLLVDATLSTLHNINEQRSDLFDAEVVSNQYYVSSNIKGYNSKSGNPVKLDRLSNVYDSNADTRRKEVAILRKGFDKLASIVEKGDKVEAIRKSGFGKIPSIKMLFDGVSVDDTLKQEFYKFIIEAQSINFGEC